MNEHEALDSNIVPAEGQRNNNFKSFLATLKDDLLKNSGLLFRTLAIYALPIIAFSFFANYFFLNTGTQIENLYYLKGYISNNDYVFLLFNTLVFVAGLCIMTMVTNVLIHLTDKAEGQTREHLVADLKKELANHFKTYALNFLIIFIFYYVLKLCTGFLGSFYPFNSEDGLDLEPFNDQMNIVFQIVVTLLIMPLVFYFGFSALYVSLKENIGASDALQKVHEVSIPHLKRIWGFSIVLYLIGLIAVAILGYLTSLIADVINPGSFTFFIVFFIQKLVVISLFALMNVASVSLFNIAAQTPHQSAELIEGVEPTVN